MKENHVSIWFLIGLQLALYGILILGAGVYGIYHPPEKPTVLENLHPAIPWGAIMLVLGIFYALKFYPEKRSKTVIKEGPTQTMKGI
jgi:hypothetical protein